MRLYKLYLLSLFFALATAISLFAQSSNNFPMLDNMEQMKKNSEKMLSTDTKDAFPVGNVIDANNYYVGPNDVLAIQILPFESVPTPTVVTAENTIVSPRFGEVNINGLTLKQIRDTLANILKERNSGNTKHTVSVSLSRPRNVFVTVSGNVVAPGTYTLPASYSVSTVLKIANQIQSVTTTTTEEQAAIMRLQESRKERERIFSETGVSFNSSYSTRNIRVIRKSGTALIADIERALATGNHAFDPFICEGDEIFVPFEPSYYPTVSIVGEVIRPATVTYKKGDMASHLLKLAAGFTESADINAVYLYDETHNAIQLTVDSLCNLLSSDIELKAGNIIIVRAKIEIDSANTGMVSVSGEVNNPSVYPITVGKTRLKDAVKMAGGLTSKAYLPLSYIGRRDNMSDDRIAPKRLYTEYFQRSDLTMEDTARFMMDIDLKRPAVSCDFDAAFNNNSDDDNVYLQDGDVIHVGKNPKRIYVWGQVNKPGYVDYAEGKSMEWYIAKAGGYATGAEKKRSRIIRGNSRVWEDGFNKNIYVNDGDEIYVPRPPDVPPTVQIQKWAAIVGMIGGIVGTLTLIYTTLRK